MRPDARTKLWFRSIRNSTKWRNPEETEEVMTSGLTKEEPNSSASMESMRMESKPCSKSTTAWSRNK